MAASQPPNPELTSRRLRRSALSDLLGARTKENKMYVRSPATGKLLPTVVKFHSRIRRFFFMPYLRVGYIAGGVGGTKFYEHWMYPSELVRGETDFSA